MSAPAAGISGRRAARFYDSTVGKKFVMAISGIILFGYVIAHLLGNLQIFLGPAQFNGYARFLHSVPELLWPARIVLLIAVILHIWSSLHLAVVKSEARPVGYVKKRADGSSYASRTMYWSGPIIAAFVIYHLLQFTFGMGGTPYQELDAYGNVINGFRVPVVAIFYIIAMALLCLHLRHGLWSMVQSLGRASAAHAGDQTQRARPCIAFGFIYHRVLTRLIPQVI